MITQSTRNALHNVTNPSQGNHRRVLCVCSAGLLRSPSVARVLQEDFGYNTRACGISDYALIPVSTALLRWADDIVFVEEYVRILFESEVEPQLYQHCKVITLDIPDNYDTFEPELMRLIREQYNLNKAVVSGGQFESK